MDYREHHRHIGFIPAGVLIGLGLGLLAGYPGSGVLIGLGLGFLATGVADFMKKTPEAAEQQKGGTNVTMPLIGIFMILVGIGIAWPLADLWPYVIAGFLILLGISFLVRGFNRSP